MSVTNYSEMAREAIGRYADLIAKREELEVEIAKLNQYLRATINLLPDHEKAQYAAKLTEVFGSSLGLAEAIRQVLRSNGQAWMTVSHIRNELVRLGFDFSNYTANPLASVSTTVRRMKDREIQIGSDDGIAAYSWKPTEDSDRLREFFGTGHSNVAQTLALEAVNRSKKLSGPTTASTAPGQKGGHADAASTIKK